MILDRQDALDVIDKILIKFHYEIISIHQKDFPNSESGLRFRHWLLGWR